MQDIYWFKADINSTVEPASDRALLCKSRQTERPNSSLLCRTPVKAGILAEPRDRRHQMVHVWIRPHREVVRGELDHE